MRAASDEMFAYAGMAKRFSALRKECGIAPLFSPERLTSWRGDNDCDDDDNDKNPGGGAKKGGGVLYQHHPDSKEGSYDNTY